MNKAYSQAEIEPWGNITGIRKNGQLFNFESSLKVESVDGKFISTGKERQKPHYKRTGDEQQVTTSIDSLFFKETVKDLSRGKIKVAVSLTAHADQNFKGIFFCIELPAGDYPDSRLRFKGVSDSLRDFVPAAKNYDETAKGIEVVATNRKLKIDFDEPTMVMVRTANGNGRDMIQLWIALQLNKLQKGEVVEKAYTIKASGPIDKTPANLTINNHSAGRAFDGLGGNFRLQNPKTDGQVIDYCLDNLRVAWSRVELPWHYWQPKKDVDPIATADSGKLHPEVQKAIQMAHRLDSLGIPIVLSAWFPPDWAVTGKLNYQPVNGIWGNPLNKDNMDAIYTSIGDYITYLKNKYGIKVKLFSFNESDLGINIRLTAQDHDDFIKGCGAYFEAHGIATKMLLGDNSDATTYQFIYPALNDTAARRYIGAISFHSWRGTDAATLQKWADAATQLQVPLLVGEGSIDAAAYSYPDIFQEPTYALKEIDLYTRLLAICQPQSILQWQLTADYSPLIGGGIFGNNEPLHPGQRFWNLKQLSNTPKGLFVMPAAIDNVHISCVALGDNSTNTYVVHLVNNGPTREVNLSGLPDFVSQLQVVTTTQKLNMKQGRRVKVTNGQAKFKLPATGFTTLTAKSPL